VDNTLVTLVHKKQPAEMLRWGSYNLHHWKQRHAIISNDEGVFKMLFF